MRKLLLIFVAFVPLSLYAQNECSNNPPNIAIAVNNSRSDNGVVHQTICWNPQTSVISIPSLVFPSSSPLTTKGDLFTFTTVNARLPVGTNGQCLTAQSAQTTGLQWAACGGGTSFPINLPDGSSVAPQLSSATNPTDGFYIASGFPNWIFEVGGTQMYALRGTVAGGSRAFAFGASTQPCWSSSNTLDANASSNCDTYLSRASANALNLGSSASSVDGTFNTGTVKLSTSLILPDGTLGNSSLYWNNDGPGQGFYNFGGVNQVKCWGDSGGLGSNIWCWTGQGNSAQGLLVTNGTYVGIGDETTGACLGCITANNANPTLITGINVNAQGTPIGNIGATAFISKGSTFTTNSGCTDSALIGGATIGQFTSGATLTCTDIITMGAATAATNGWACSVTDRTTTAAVWREINSTTTTATIQATGG